VTTYVNRRKRCHYVANIIGTNDYCTLNLYVTPGSSCPSNVAAYFNPTACVGWDDSCTDVPCSISSSSSIVSCTAGQTGCRSVAQTVTHPPATISGNINCPQIGDNGYCTAAASLSLSGNEPLSGYNIIALEGTHNGITFACSGDSCSVNLVEGANTFTFWALSDWGDSSLMGTANRSVDTRPPSISGSASGSPGSGSWYVSPVTVTASASDPSPGSGLDSFEAGIDGIWGAYSGPITLNDGDHTVELLATDNAGWTDSTSMSFQIDSIAPTTVFTDPTDTTWATGTLTLSGVSSDLNLSGVEISYNGGGTWSGLSPDEAGNWSTSWDTRSVANDSYSVRARGRDHAGNIGGAAVVTIMVDNGEPHIYIPDSWPIWQTAAINVVDNGIGVDRVRLTIHGGQYGERVYNWSSGPDDFKWDRRFGDVIAPIGGYPVEVEAWDRVGNKGAAWGEIVIPAPDEAEEDEEEPGVLSIEVPEEPPSEPPSTSGKSEPASQPTNTPEPPKVVLFSGESSGTGESSDAGNIGAEEISPPAGSSNLLLGAAAVAAIGSAMAVVAAAKKKREEKEKQEAAAAAKFNQSQIALEKERAQKAAQARWEAEQEAARAEAEAAALLEASAQDVQTNQTALSAAVQAMKFVGSWPIEKMQQIRAAYDKRTLERTHSSTGLPSSLAINTVATSGYIGLSGAAVISALPRAVEYASSYSTSMLNPGNFQIPNPAYVGYMHEPLWAYTNNANPVSVIQNGWASLGPIGSQWDGVLQGPGRAATDVQLKAVVPEGYSMVNQAGRVVPRPQTTYMNTVQGHGQTASGYGSNQRMLVTSEAAEDLGARVGNTSQGGSSGVSYSESENFAQQTGSVSQGIKPSQMTGWRFQLWREPGFWRAANSLATKAAARAGAVGAVITGGLSTVFNVAAYRRGEIDGAQAGANVLIDTGIGAVSGLAAGWAGAMAGAAVGSVVPGFGTVIGGVTGFIAGMAVGYGVSSALNTITEPLRTKVADGIRAWQGIAENAGEIASKVGDKIGEAVSSAVENVKEAGREAIESVGNFFSGLFGG
jgi:gas vesicle protein